MKYDILDGFKEYALVNTDSPHTAKRYYSAVKMLLSDIQFNNLQEVSMELLQQKLECITGKSNFSATKNGLLLLKEYDPNLQLPDEAFFSCRSITKRDHRKSNDIIVIGKVKRKINQIRDKKLKLSYRLAMVSGLRVFEIEALEKRDIEFGDDNSLVINVRHGKGDKQRYVNCIPDAYVYKNLMEYVKEMDTHTRLFYSEEKMRKEADHLDMECHDFRRIYAFLHKKILKKEYSTYETNKILQQNLGHARYKTTKRYLYGKKIIE